MAAEAGCSAAFVAFPQISDELRRPSPDGCTTIPATVLVRPARRGAPRWPSNRQAA